MKVICPTSKLVEAALNVQKAVMTKTTMPVLEGILFRAQDGVLKMTGYDLELGIETEVEADIIEAGSVVIKARTFCDIIRHLPYDKVIMESDDSNSQCKIYCGDIEYFVTGMNPRDYPELPVVQNEKMVPVSAAVLKDMIRKTIFSVAIADVRVIHKGIKFEIEPGEIRLVAIDSHRIALRREFIEYDGEAMEFVVPSKTMNELLRLIGDEDTFLHMGVGKRHIIFRYEGYYIVSRLLEGEFMKYQSIIPTSFNTAARVQTKPFIESLERVSLIINDSNKAPLRLNFSSDTLKISTVTAIGSASDRIEISCDGQELEIGMQSKFLLEALRAGEKEEVLIQMIDSLRPLVIVPTDGESFLYLILPVRLV